MSADPVTLGSGGAAVGPAVVAERLRSQLLAGTRPTTVAGVVRHLLAVQAQDARGFRLAVRPRSDGPTAADVERALTVERSVVVSTLNRGTLHLVPVEDLGWLHALTTPQLATASARRLAQEGVTPDAAARGIAAVERALAAEGPLDRAALRERVAAAGVRVQGQAFVHVVLAATLQGLVVRGPVVDGEHRFALRTDWLGPVGRRWTGDRDAALVRLAERYLAGHAPATDRDLARWAGIGLGDARRGLRGLGARLRVAGTGLLRLAGATDGPAPPGPGPLLLGAFDPVLLGWADRGPLLRGRTALVTSNGVFRPFVLVDGHAVGTWGMPGGTVVVHPFDPLPDAVTAALHAEAADVARHLGRPADATPRVRDSGPVSRRAGRA